jgi:DNA polymerase-3 subunit epsilon
LKILGIDTETTGLSQEKGHRIIEVAAILVDYQPGQPMKALKRFVSRSNPHRAVDPDAYEVHRISDAELVGAPEWELVVPPLEALIRETDLLIAHNFGFDGPFLAAEMLRIAVVPPDCATFCTMENGRWAHPLGKLPKLQEVCFALGIPYDPSKAHAAEYDIWQTLKCLQAGIARGFYTLPTLETTHAAAA